LFGRLKELFLLREIPGELVARLHAKQCAISDLEQALNNLLLRENLVLAQHFLNLSKLGHVPLLDLNLDFLEALLLDGE